MALTSTQCGWCRYHTHFIDEAQGGTRSVSLASTKWSIVVCSSYESCWSMRLRAPRARHTRITQQVSLETPFFAAWSQSSWWGGGSPLPLPCQSAEAVIPGRHVRREGFALQEEYVQSKRNLFLLCPETTPLHFQRDRSSFSD